LLLSLVFSVNLHWSSICFCISLFYF
jgi:hypothetical protein